MKRCVLSAFAVVATLLSTQTVICRADTLVAGAISFDSGVSPSFNTFDLINLTGLNAGPPDAIADNELFSGTLNVTIGNLSTLYTFSNVDIYGNGTNASGGTIASIPIGTDVASAVLTLTLSKSLGVSIYGDNNPNTVIANLLSVPAITLSPLSGGSLTPCDGSGSPCATAAITVNTAPATTAVTPEPETVWLVLTGLGGAAALRRRLLGR